MKKTLFALLVLSLSFGLISCEKNKKFNEATEILATSFVNLGKFQQKGTGFAPDTMCYDGKDVLVKLAVEKDVAPIPNFSFDKWIKPYVVSTLFAGSINTYVLSRTLETKQGGNPGEDYFKLMEESGAQLKVAVKTPAGEKNYVITPEEAKKLLNLPQEERTMCAASSAFIAQIKDFKTNQVVKDVTIEDNVCCIDLIIDEKFFVSKLETMPAILSYVILNNLDLKINDTVIPKEEVQFKWEIAKHSLLNDEQENKGKNMA